MMNLGQNWKTKRFMESQVHDQKKRTQEREFRELFFED